MKLPRGCFNCLQLKGLMREEMTCCFTSVENWGHYSSSKSACMSSGHNDNRLRSPHGKETQALTFKMEGHAKRRGPQGDGLNEESLGSISTMREETLGYLSKSKIHKCI